MENRLEQLEKQKETEIAQARKRHETAKQAIDARLNHEIERINRRYEPQIQAMSNVIKAKATQH